MSVNDKNASRTGTGTDTANPGMAKENQGKGMQGIVAYYIRYSIPEFIFCLVAAAALEINMVYGFKLTEQMRTSYGVFIAVTAVVLLLLFIFNYSSWSRLVMLPVFAAAAVVLIMFCYRMGFSLIETETREDNWGLCILIIVIITVVAFAASRTRLGSGIFAVAGSFAHAWLCVLLYTFSAWALVVFILAAGVMYLYSRYRHQMLNADARKHAFIPLVGTSVLAMVIVLVLTAGTFFGVVKPLNPPVLDITLITKVVSPEVLEIVGISTPQVLMSDEQSSEVNENRQKDSSEKNDEQQEDETVEGEQDSSPEDEAQTTEDETQLDNSIDTDSLSLTSAAGFPVLMIVLACVAAFLIVMGLRRYLLRHRIWLKKLQKDHGREEQVRRMYHLFRAKLKVLGISGAPYDPPVRQAESVASKTVFMDEGGAGWTELSAVFARLIYGGVSPTEEEYGAYLSYYKRFWKACRKYCGFRWLWKQFRL